MKFNTQFKQHNREEWFENPYGDSMAVPDQSLSVQEIIRRFSAGTLSPDEITRSSEYYNDDIDNPDPRLLDITDVEEIARGYKDAVERANAEMRTDEAHSDAAASAGE